MTLTTTETVNRWVELLRKQQELNAELKKFHETDKECPCPEKYAMYTIQSNDNGYGRWWYVRMKRCLICRLETRLDSYDTYEEAETDKRKWKCN